mmetsp:Transcript_31361/g.63654  ORF Transcript_31361/g.63654 Transcript_31361/m.63654 type:complete len:514 (-) Transcript_31361:46-1587(-)
MQVLLFAALILYVSSAADLSVNSDGSVLSVDGLSAPLQAEWLRERSTSSDWIELESLQPRYSPDQYVTPQVLSARFVGSRKAELEVVFRDGFNTTYDVGDLRKWVDAESAGAAGHAGGAFMQTAEDTDLPQLQPWTKATLGTLHTELFQDLTAPLNETGDGGDRPALRRTLHSLLTKGIMVIKGVPKVEGECSKMANLLSLLQGTNWGSQFEVRVAPPTPQTNPRDQSGDLVLNEISEPEDGLGDELKDLAYTPKSIGMHTDNPYRNPTPKYQLLHVIDQCSCEAVGEEAPCAACTVVNSFVDGFAVADLLTPQEFDLLSSVPVRFENNGGDGSTALWHTVPMFELHPHFRPSAAAAAAASDDESPPPPLQQQQQQQQTCRGASCILSIRFSTKSGGYAPLHLGPEVLQRFYAARRRFSSLVHNQTLGIQTQFSPGDLVVFDNNRVLHARSSIAPSDGGRFLQGCYSQNDGALLNYERLRRAHKKKKWTTDVDAPPSQPLPQRQSGWAGVREL